MSFTESTKNLLARVEVQEACCGKSLLAGLLRTTGSYPSVEVRVAAVARLVFKLIKESLGPGVQPRVQRHSAAGARGAVYVVTLAQGAPTDRALESIWRQGSLATEFSYEEGLRRDCCRKSYLRGVFLGCGFVSDPKQHYHLELSVQGRPHGEVLRGMLAAYGIDGRILVRKGRSLLYVKGAEEIATFLNLIGAHSALLEFENVRILKGMRNDVNRLVNCETSNLTKAIEAGLKQKEDIETISETIGLRELSPALREVARLRIEHVDASLTELGQLVSPPISKSAVNHRMRRIQRIAESIRGG